jgi:thiamine-monophosphate kinase
MRTRIGDDGARIGTWVYSKDLFFENIHFKRQWLSFFQIGYKAMIINISDAIAMNAVPRYALLGIAIPKSMSLHQMDELSSGIRAAAKQYGIEIVGGDTISNTKLDLSITIISESHHPLLRRGLKLGDVIAYTGTIGASAKQLRYLQSGGKVHSKSRFVTPVLRQSFVSQGRRYLRCGMDISDGLFSDVEKLSRANRMGIRWKQKVSKKIGCSGEEYEMLIAFPRSRLKTLQRIAARNRTTITEVAHTVRGSFINHCKRHHF